MSLGVLNNIAAIYAQTNLSQTQSRLQNTLTQLSSGSRINRGADDAAGALTQSSQNATSGVGLLQTADGALSQVTNLLNRAVTLATEAANGTLNSNQVSSANQEYQNILSEVGAIGSTTNFNGNNVFSATAKTVFVSDGTASGANVYSETVGTLTASSVGTSAPAAPVTTALTNPTPCDGDLCSGRRNGHDLGQPQCCGCRWNCGDCDSRRGYDAGGSSDTVERAGQLYCGRPVGKCGHRRQCE